MAMGSSRSWTTHPTGWSPDHRAAKGESTQRWRITTYSQTITAPATVDLMGHSLRAHTLTGLTNYQPYTITLNAMLSGTTILTDTVSVMPTDLVIYLPVVLKE